METAMDFENLRVHLLNGMVQEIEDLKEYLTPFSYQDIEDVDGEELAEITNRIFYAAEGLKKLSTVLTFMDCWEENGEPPQISECDQ